MAEPLVSVVIATHERPKLLMERALASVLAQTYTNLDVHVVGDGPNPGARNAIEALDDDRVRYTELPKQALPEDDATAWCVLGLEARNHGYDEAFGGYIAGLDDDDEWYPYTIKELMKKMQSGDYDLVYGRSKRINPDGSIGWHGIWPPKHFAYCEGAWLAKHDLGYRFDPECVKRGLPEDGDKIDRMVEGGVKFGFLDMTVHNYYPNRQ
jgi:glycosyltransferase involved in cell wall biosynthesis